MSTSSQTPQNSEKPYKLGGMSGKGFMPGQTGNPAGRPKAGMQSFKDRLARWLETKTYKEIQELVDNPKKWDKLLSIDAMVVRRIHEACQKDKTGDFVALLDRLLGKPAITADLQVTHALADRLDHAEKLLLEPPSAPLLEGTAVLLQSSILDTEHDDKILVNASSDSFEDLV